MGLRFKRSIRICKGMYINVGKTGTSLSFGVRGARYTMHSSGKRTATIGVPGTGLSYSISANVNKQVSRNETFERRRAIQKERERLVAETAEETRINALVVEEYRLYVILITTLFRECQNTIDWYGIASLPVPFQQGEKGPNQISAERTLLSYKPSLMEKVLPQKEAGHRQKLQNDIIEGIEKDKELLEIWRANTNLAKDVLAGVEDAYLFAIEKFNPFLDLMEYGCDFEIGVFSRDCLEVEFRVKADCIVPTIELSLTGTGLISRKQLSKTRYYDYVQDYVCGCCIRISRELFSLLPISTVIINATDSIVDTTNGFRKEIVILSVKYDRHRFENVDFRYIDASDFTETFPHNMKFLKTAGFKEVNRLEKT